MFIVVFYLRNDNYGLNTNLDINGTINKTITIPTIIKKELKIGLFKKISLIYFLRIKKQIKIVEAAIDLSLIHISEPTRPY